jgi:hypothetical protein
MSTINLTDDLAALLNGIFSGGPQGATAVAEPEPEQPKRELRSNFRPATPEELKLPPQEEKPRYRRSYRGPRRRGYIKWKSVEQFTVTEASGKIGIQFPKKPSDAIRAAMRAAGWEFSGFNGTWSNVATDANRAFAQQIRKMYGA